MNSSTILFCVILTLNIVAFWLYDKRTRRLLWRYKETADEVFDRLEARLIKGSHDFDHPVREGLTWAIMFTYNRQEMAARTLQTLRRHEPTLPILVVDNGSDDGTQQMLVEMLKAGAIDKVLLNRHIQVPQWQKGFAMQQAVKILAIERPQYFVWLDDDLEVVRPFVNASVSMLQTLRAENVRVICLTDNEDQESNHGTIKQIEVVLPSGHEMVKIRPTFNGAFNFIATEFFREFGYPPTSEGINARGSEDWFYSRLMQDKNYRAAVYVAANILAGPSKREEVSKLLYPELGLKV